MTGALLAVVLVVPATSASAAGPTTQPVAWAPDGSTQERAAASCWEIKQRTPSAPDGVYWLVTPALIAPQQFYCDMTTDGGGWVLVGRGRDGWSESGDAQGTPAQVRTDIWDVAGFKPKKLSDEVINGLLNDTAPMALPDGVRIVRAANDTGTATTDIRMHLTHMPSWSWAFSAGQPGNATVYGPSTSRNPARQSAQMIANTTTRLISTSSPLTTLRTDTFAANGWVAGFTCGQRALGVDSSTSFLYSAAANEQWATPMTQIWLRPELSTSSMVYPQIPDSGSEASQQLPLASSAALPGTWGVTGQANGNTSELDTEAHAFAQIGNVMYVGGNFARVEEHADRTPGGAASQSFGQSYLAAFDARTGAWIPGFRPVLNNQVNSLAALPNGDLAVGGQFTTVNGQAQAGLVALDPVTGATDSHWHINVEDRIAGEAVNVQTMDVSGGWLYLGGNFTHLTGGTRTSAVYARKAARVAVADATPDPSWNPAFDGKVQSIDVSADGTRVYAAGYFTTSGSTPVDRVAILSTAPGAAVIPFSPLYSVPISPYQQAIHATGDMLWVGGSEHSMFGYDAASLAPKSLNITRSGGDIQAITDNNAQVVYGGCHCGGWVFTGQQEYSFTIPSSDPTWAQAHRISYVGAWDARTGSYLPAFAPTWKSRVGYGAWALAVASDGTLWAGGSFTSVIATDGRNQWAGGFVRFAVRPHTAPDAPTALSATLSGSVATLSWKAPSTPVAGYEVLRGGRVVGTTQQTTLDVPDSAAGDRFFVRATDGAGNRSATTTVAVAHVPPPSLIPANATWRYYVDAGQPPAGTWTSIGFDDSAWHAGAAPLGWGSASIATNVDVASGQQRPITTYYRHAFDLGDPAGLPSLSVTTQADDGVVVYLNGVEIGRKNLPSGPIGPATFAISAPTTSTAAADPLVLPVNRSLLRAGRNVIAVEVHANYRATPNISMALTLTAGG